jgi:hypothetical protein
MQLRFYVLTAARVKMTAYADITPKMQGGIQPPCTRRHGSISQKAVVILTFMLFERCTGVEGSGRVLF